LPGFSSVPANCFQDSRGGLDAWLSQSCAAFFWQFFSARLTKLAPACDPAPMAFAQVICVAYHHMRSRSIIADRLPRFPDPCVAHF